MSTPNLPEIPPGPADVTFPRRALSRLALSSAAAEASELAAGAVPTVSDAYGSAYETVEFAARILSSAREMLTRAVVHARELGGSWADIAEALSVTPAEAEELYTEAVQHWERALDEPVVRSGRYLSDQLPDGANNPAWYAEHLDQWCTGRFGPGDGVVSNARHAGIEDRMVSANLPKHTDLTEMNSVLRYSLYLINRGEPITAAERDAHDARKAAVWARYNLPGGAR